jgi:hypothetical protein
MIASPTVLRNDLDDQIRGPLEVGLLEPIKML